MPNQRSKGQRLINVPMNEEFIQALDAAVSASGIGDRSKFIRAAILEKAATLVRIPAALANAPSRIGKGGRSSTRPPATDASMGDGGPPIEELLDDIAAKYMTPGRKKGRRASRAK